MAKSRNPRKPTKEKQSHHSPKLEKPHSWAAMKSLFTCKYLQVHQQQQQVQLRLEKQNQHQDSQKKPVDKKKQRPEQAQKTQQDHNQLQETFQMQKQKQKLKQAQEEQHEQNKQLEEFQNQKQKQKQKQKMKQAQEEHQEELQSKNKLEQNQKQKETEQQVEKSSHKSKKQGKPEQLTLEEMNKKSKKMKCSGSLCSNTKVMHRPELSPPEEQKKKAALLMGQSSESNGLAVSNSWSWSSSSFTVPSNSPSISGSFRNIRKLSGCYECRMVVDPVLGMTRDPSLRNTIRSCSECGEIFMKAENLELHQSVRHAVSELGAEDTSKNIVEIIFQSSWLKKQAPVCKIERILKVQNTPKTISKFEEYRDTIKVKATRQPKKHPRCLADGNELLRFYCTTLTCSLGLNGSSNLCSSIPNCNVCSVIKNGFKVTSDISTEGILTTATSGKAHDSARVAMDDGRRAMLVCRVIAGRVKKNPEGGIEDYDSVAGVGGVYSNLDELYVFNPWAILPCFVVIYTGF